MIHLIWIMLGPGLTFTKAPLKIKTTENKETTFEKSIYRANLRKFLRILAFEKRKSLFRI